MRNLIVYFFFGILISFNSYASSNASIKCKKDLNFFQSLIKNNSSIYADKENENFQNWFTNGYDKTLELIKNVTTNIECYYAIKYYTNGFNITHINISKNVETPLEKYPGFLSIKDGVNHKIIYKDTELDYLKNIQIGDTVTHINDIEIEDYYKKYLLPFYSADKSELYQNSASLHAFLIDGNNFKPLPKNVTTSNGKKSLKTELKYTEIYGEAFKIARQIKRPDSNRFLKIKKLNNLIWISIPSFSPSEDDIKNFQNMLAQLKNNFAKYDYILFDLRGNLGGASKWSRPIIRNLWGDDYIKSLGDNHDYNKKWIKKIRVSKDGFQEFKANNKLTAQKAYANALRENRDFILKKWNIFDDMANLYTNMDDNSVSSKIYVLTDNFCRSTCWTFLNEITQIPDVVHLGKTTSIQNQYSFAKRVTSPTKFFDFFYPTQIRLYPSYGDKKEIVPSKIYDGNMQDDEKLIDWVFDNLT